jgi:AraC-like DNA-binding protein
MTGAERGDGRVAGVSPDAFRIVAEVLQRVVDDLDRPWTLEGVAATAGYQEHHFVHIFTAVIGEPPLRHLRRLRLERAAYQLISDPALSVHAIASSAGYGSIEAFSRAFRRAFGASPRSFRRDASRTGGAPARPRAHPEVDAVHGFPPGLAHPPKITSVGPLHGWTIRTRSFDDMAEVQSALTTLLAARPPDGPWQLGGVSPPWGWITDGHPRELRVLRLTPPSLAPPGPPLLPWRLPRGWFACFDYEGPLDRIADVCRWIMETWVPRSGLRTAFAPFFSLLEEVNPVRARARLHAPVAELSVDGS